MINTPAQKIILTGYRASDKATIGGILAVRLGFEFLDMDTVISERAGNSLEQIVNVHGWDYFRALEYNLLEELIGREDIVIATGGGAILHQDIWPALMRSGLVVWLMVDLENIRQCLAADHMTSLQRLSLIGKDPFAEMAAVLKERQPLYENGSHMTLDSGAFSPEFVAEEIIKVLPDILPY